MFAERKVTPSVAGVGNWNAQHISSFKEEPTLIPLQFYLFNTVMEEIARGKSACPKVPVWYGFLKLVP